MFFASNLSGGLGIFEEGPSCGDGSDFICGPKGGVFSCRPCDFSQLAAFKQLQKMANQLVVSLGMSNKPAVITGLNSCTGGDILALDGRVGPCTKRTVANIVTVFGIRKMPPASDLLAVGTFESTPNYIARVIPELLEYFSQLIVLTNAPKDVPAPAQQPISRVPGSPGKVPPAPEASNGFIVPRPPSRAGAFVGILGVLAAAGLVGTAVYYYRGENF